MKSVGTVLTLIILVAIFVGGGTFYFTDQKLAKQKDELSQEIKNLKSRTNEIEGKTDKVASDIASQKSVKAETDVAKTDSNAPAAANQETTTTATAASITPIDTAKWKTFASTKYNYSIKYPADWDYKDNTSGTAMNSIGFKPKAVKDAYAFSVVVEKSTIDYSIGLVKKQMAVNYTFKNQSTADINGTSFTALNFESKTNAAQKPVVYLAAKDDLVYHFTATDNTDANANANTAEMIKTFQMAK